MSKPTFMIKDIRWWHRPIRLAVRRGDSRLEFVGWVWNQRAFLVNNLNHGWIAFVEDQTEEQLRAWKCDICGAPLSYSTRRAIAEHYSKKDGTTCQPIQAPKSGDKP